MSDDALLTLDSAVSFMLSDPKDDKAPAAAATPEPAAASAEAPAAEETPAAEGDNPAAAEDTPADQGETTEGQADQGDDALPPIEPPTSWTAEEKAEWKTTPRKAQEAILRRELDNHKEIRNLQNSSAEQRKAADAEVTRLKAITAQVDLVLNEKVQDLAREFPEIKSEADVVALAQSDPARHGVFQARLMQLQAATQARAQAAKEISTATEKMTSEQTTKAKDALLEAFPTWKEPAVARKEATELQDYVVKTFNVPEAAARSTIDPVIYKLAQKAMLYDRAQAAKVSAVTRDPPRVVKPGSQTVSPKVAAKEANRSAQLKKLGETGAIEDAIGLLLA